MLRVKNSLAISKILGASALIGGMGLTVASAWLITMASQHPPLMVLSVCIVLVRFFGISRSVARYAERIVSHESVFNRLTNLRMNLFTKINDRSLLLANGLNSGNFVKSIVDDVERAQEYQLRNVLPKSAAALSLIVAIGIGFWIQPLLPILFVPVSLILLVGIPLLVSRVCIPLSKLIEGDENSYSHLISNVAYGSLEARVFGYEGRLLSELDDRADSILSLELRQLREIRRYQFLSLLAIGSSLVGSALLMYLISLSTSIPQVSTAMAIFLPLVAFEGINLWYPNLFVSGKLLRAQETIESLLVSEREYSPISIPTPKGSVLQLRNFAVAWDKPIMKPINLELHRGDLLVVRGRSGSGKSTFALGLTGFLQYSGSALLGDVEIDNFSDLSPFMCASLQQGHIFNTSIRENLKIASGEVDDIEIRSILDLLELNYLGLDEIVGEFGRTLSGGEAKRLGIARCLLSKAPLVILDEPTEHLDSELALRVESAITDACRERSLIVITHDGWSKSTRTVSIERE